MSVTEFFRGKCVFITGGSGFIGKVLIEKLLRSCDGIDKVYLLLRKKKDLSPEERLKKIVECPLFDTLKKRNPEFIKKLVPICGDVMELKLGLTDEDTKSLIENVDIIYHGAASVRFDDHLKDSVLLNTRGTREVIDIALQCSKLVTFVHISTTYCNSDKMEIEEKLYPPHADWRNTITLTEQIDQHTLSILTPQYICPLPNTYTFAKSLAEHVVNDLCKDKLLTTIVRPSVVVSSVDDPIPGWIDNFNGPLGLMSAGGKGILKMCYGDETKTLDCMAVDVLVKILILAAYQKTLSKDLTEVSIYNAAAGDHSILKYSDLTEMGAKIVWDTPYTNLMWYPSFSLTNNWYVYYVTFLLYQLLPALIVDGLLKLAGRKPILVKIQRKVYTANMALVYFMQHSWKFKNSLALGIYKMLEEVEKQKFSFVHCLDLTKEEIYAFFLKSKIATSKTLFKEEFNREKGFRNILIFWIINSLLHITVIGVLCWYCISTIFTV